MEGQRFVCLGCGGTGFDAVVGERHLILVCQCCDEEFPLDLTPPDVIYLRLVNPCLTPAVVSVMVDSSL